MKDVEKVKNNEGVGKNTIDIIRIITVIILISMIT